MPHPRRLRLFPIALLFWSSAAAAQEAPGLSAGDTAWIITATALVLFMTLPGLALFYGGLVRTEESAVRADALLLDLLPGLGALAGRRLQPGVQRGRPGDRRPGAGVSRRRRHRRPHRNHTRGRLLHVPDDLCDHHAGADRRRLSRAHHLSCGPPVQRRLAAPGLCPGRALDLGRRLARRARRHGLSPAAWWSISPRGRRHWSWHW